MSERYAREIQTPEGGSGLDAVVREHAHKLTGILNGVDYDIWNPAKDTLLFDSAASGATTAAAPAEFSRYAVNQSLAVGDRDWRLRIWTRAPLGETYQETWKVFPAPLKRLLESLDGEPPGPK